MPPNNSLNNKNQDDQTSNQPAGQSPVINTIPASRVNPGISQSPVPSFELPPKKNTKKRNIILLVLLIVLIAGGAIAGYLLTREKPAAPVQSKQSDNKAVNNIDTKDIASARSEMGLSLIREIKNKQSDKNSNIFISPTSISTALTMVQAGASGETKAEMRSSLNLSEISDSDLNAKNKAIMDRFADENKQVTASIANSVWIDDMLKVKSQYTDLLKDTYLAEIQNLDLQAADTPDKIDQWASRKTNDKIKQIAQRPVPGDQVMTLLNAVYFKGTWKYQFEESNTSNRDFTNAAGGKKTAPLMRIDSSDLKHYKNADVQAIELPYGEDGKFVMNVILPNDLDTYLKDLDNEKLTEILGKLEKGDGTLLLPRFKMETDYQLKDPLIELGINKAFSNNAEFDGIVENTPGEEDIRIKISDVIHKIFVEVNEEGTEAAAVTKVDMIAVESVGSPSGYYMEVNKPFFLMIREVENNEPLFMGAINSIN